MGLLDLQPHVVSKNLKGYSVLFYGDIKSGKTTNATKFPRALLFATEKGYSALPGVYAYNVNSWSDLLKGLRELKDPAVQEKFETIVIDTADLAYDYCEQYICNVEGVDAISKIPFGQGFTKVAKEFDTRLRQIIQLGYGLVLISHSQDKVFTNEDGTEYNRIVPTLGNKARLVVSRMCDIVAYSRIIETEAGVKPYLFLRGTPRFEAGSRFKYITDRIEFKYEDLVNAISDAIDKEAAEHDNKFVTDQRENLYVETHISKDFDELMKEFQEITATLVAKNAAYYAPRITEIVDRHLGKGKKVSDCTRDQAMLIEIIVSELKDLE